MLISEILRNRYKIIKLLGSRGFGDTYLAEDLDLPNHAKCVVKHLKPNSNPTISNLQNLAALAEAIPIFYRQSTIARNN
jgi:eukaryotic-like serine/threonine-protein kinase